MSNTPHVVRVTSTSTSPRHRLRSVYDHLRSSLLDKRYFWVLSGLVVLGDAFLTQLIIHFIPYTEIDWETYMVHIDLYLAGERNYTKLTGPTGPLVYPAGHVHIHRWLHLLTDGGLKVALAQQVYGALYILSLVLVCCIYRQAGTPNWTVLLLPLSKRLHSIFALRLFNDCWSIVFVQASILAFQTSWDDLGTLFFSLGLSIKMSALLYLPALLVILFKRHGLLIAIRHLCLLILAQFLLAYTFLADHAPAYLQNAFDLSRVFMYKWTVNWRFLNEDTFLSRSWARGLLVGHLTMLVAFGLFRWCRADGGVVLVLRQGFCHPKRPATRLPVSADYVATVLLTCNLIGILFARSLHYQFYSWYAQQVPFLAQRTKYPILVQLAILAGIEYSWNVFPSTSSSSTILLASNSALILGIWFGYAEGKPAI